MTQPNQETEISELKESVALLTALLARGADRAERENSGEAHKSPALIAHEKLTAKVALALKPRTEIPPENADDCVTVTLKEMRGTDRHPEWCQSFVGVVLHDPSADEYVEFNLGCLIPSFVPKRFWQGSFPRECSALNVLMQIGVVTVKPGLVVESQAVAKEWGEALGSAYLYAGTAKNRITEDEMLRAARLIDPFEPKLARDLRSLAAGVAVAPSAFGITGGEADEADAFFDN